VHSFPCSFPLDQLIIVSPLLRYALVPGNENIIRNHHDGSFGHLKPACKHDTHRKIVPSVIPQHGLGFAQFLWGKPQIGPDSSY
jgi:hypothetical protein